VCTYVAYVYEKEEGAQITKECGEVVIGGVGAWKWIIIHSLFMHCHLPPYLWGLHNYYS